MRFVCIIEARMRSSRLPGKVLLPILGKPLLQHMLERLHLARTVDQVVVATTDERSDDPIAHLCKQLGVGVHRGSEDDVLDRVVRTAEAFEADVIVESTGDCPLVDPGLVDKVVSDFRIGGADFVANMLEYTTPRGTDVRVFRAADLALINRRSADPADHEHVSLHFWEHPENYRLRNVRTEFPAEVANFRLTVDTPADYELIRQVFEALYPGNPAFTLADVLELLRRRPELARINEAIEQKSVR